MLTCYVNGQCLTIKQPIVAADTIDYITAEFIFRTNEWDGLTKIAVFRQGEVTHTALLVDDKIEADAHVNLTEGDWEVGLIGESIDGEEIVRRITTELKTISVDRAAPNGGDPFPEYAGGVGEQIVAKAAEYMESARDSESSASMHAMIANSAANFAANERYFAEEAKEQAVAAKDAAVDAKEYIEGIAIDIGIIGELITKDIGDWYHYDHTSDATYSANFLKTGSTIKSWPEATMMRSAISPIRTVGDDLYIFAFGYKWTRESMAMLPMEVFATVEQLYRRFLIDDKVVTYGVREALTKDIYVVSFGYKQGKWFYTNTRMDGSKIEAYWDEGSLDFSSFVVRYSDAATPYADDVDLDDDTLKAIQSKLDISTKLSELDTDVDHRTVTDAEKAAWNAKSNFSGFYYDLIGKPSIPNKLASLEQDSTHRTVTDAEKAIWNSQSAPLTSNLLKGDGRGGMTEATPSRDYVDYNRDVSLSMVKSSYTFTSHTNFSVAAGDTTKIGGGTLLLKGYQNIELESPSATLNGKDIATVDDISTGLAEYRTSAEQDAIDAEKADISAIPNLKTYRPTESDVTPGSTTSPYSGVKIDVTDETVTGYADGMIVNLLMPIQGNTYGVNFQINDFGYHPIVYGQKTSIGSRYSANTPVIAIYNANQSVTMYDVGAHEIMGCWQVVDNDLNDPTKFHDYRLARTPVDDIPRTMICMSDGEKVIPVNSTPGGSSSTTKTKFTNAEFDPFDKIYYYSSTGVTVPKDTPSTSAYFYTKSELVDLRFAFNGITTSASTSILRANASCYLVCVPQNNGKAKLYYGESGTDYKSCLTMSLPTSEDGLIYIYLGQMFDAYRILLSEQKPVYWYKNGGIRLYTGADYALKSGRVEESGKSSLPLAVSDGTEYYISDCTGIVLSYPSGHFECYIRIAFGSSVDITFPTDTKYIGEEPQFAVNDIWEISIKDGVVVAGKAE